MLLQVFREGAQYLLRRGGRGQQRDDLCHLRRVAGRLQVLDPIRLQGRVPRWCHSSGHSLKPPEQKTDPGGRSKFLIKILSNYNAVLGKAKVNWSLPSPRNPNSVPTTSPRGWSLI